MPAFPDSLVRKIQLSVLVAPLRLLLHQPQLLQRQARLRAIQLQRSVLAVLVRLQADAVRPYLPLVQPLVLLYLQERAEGEPSWHGIQRLRKKFGVALEEAVVAVER